MRSLPIDKFIEIYDTFTIGTLGTAYSKETFGDIGKGKFGPRTFETKHVNNHDFKRKHLVFKYSNDGPFDIRAEIGIGLKRMGTKLYLQPIINSWMYSTGAT